LTSPKSILDLYNKTNPKKPKQYTVGLNIINERVINNSIGHRVGSIVSASPPTLTPTYITSNQSLAISIFNDTLEVYNILQTYSTYASANAFALVVDP
jgi:hypothetical protein